MRQFWQRKVGTGGEAYGFLDGFPGLLKGQSPPLPDAVAFKLLAVANPWF